MKMNAIDVARLREVFRLDEDGKLFYKIKTSPKTVVGSQAGCPDSKGYLIVQVDGKLFKVHRIVWAMTHGRWPDNCIDHINMVKSDNRPANLREATVSQNMCNRRAYSNNRSGIKGVNLRNGKWHAEIQLDGEKKKLGKFLTPEAAAAAYADAVLMHGEFARTS